jgi:polysaccharide biosynthesis protein VpsJ
MHWLGISNGVEASPPGFAGNSDWPHHNGYKAADAAAALRTLTKACEFFHSGLQRIVRKDGSCALSYTPLDQMQIINVQADIGSLLIRTGEILRDNRHLLLGTKLIDCVLRTQNVNGSWCYYAPDSIGGQSYIDNHHTGMVLSALAEVCKVAVVDNDLGARSLHALKAGVRYFTDHLFTIDGTPKYYNTEVYPIETYNFAQSIITCLDVRPLLEGSLSMRVEERLQQLVAGLVRTMQTPSGGFLYRRTRWFKQDLGSLRWANALAGFALARWLREEGCYSGELPAAA